jgi:glucose/mannose-6-phosphate isomerase
MPMNKMYEAIKNFNQQFSYEPEIMNFREIPKGSEFIIAGMGGSALAAMLLKMGKPEMDIIIHKDYGLPKMPEEKLAKKEIILSSYSGNTEETLEAFREAKEKNLKISVIAAGGKLLALAKEHGLPYVQIPDIGIQPRMATGFATKAFLKIIGENEELKIVSELATSLDPVKYEESGRSLAKKTKDHIPVVYTSLENLPIGYIWKIKLNETGKIPAFQNVLPELNHNEMTSYDVQDSTRELNSKFHFIILKDGSSKILKRMEVLEELYKARGLPVEIILVEGKNVWQKIFSTLVLGDWFAYYSAMEYGLESEQVPMVEAFKKLLG